MNWKLSFPIPSSRVRARPGGDVDWNGNENKDKLFVTEFDSSIQSTWRPIKRMKLPAANSEAIGFVAESLPAEKLSCDTQNLENERVGKLGLGLGLGFMPAVTGCALPQEIEEAILLRLPVRSLLRFKAVSEEFRSLISSRRFISDHRSKAEKLAIMRCVWNRSWLLLRNSPGIAHAPVIEALLDHRIGGLPVEDNFYLVGSANGLVCIKPKWCLPDSEKRPYILWNPATRQFKNIPRPSIKGDNDMSLEFGYRGGIEEDYMLFGVSEGCSSIHVFSLRRGTWRKTNCCLNSHPYYAFRHSSSRVVLDGFLYFLVHSYNSIAKAELLAFDCESLTRMSLPAIVGDHVDNQALAVRNKMLHWFSLCAGVLDVWVMMKSSWTRVHTADLYAAAGFSVLHLRLIRAYWQGSRALLDGYYNRREDQQGSWSYDILTSTWIEIHSLTPQTGNIIEACDYVESLVPPAGEFLLN